MKRVGYGVFLQTYPFLFRSCLGSGLVVKKIFKAIFFVILACIWQTTLLGETSSAGQDSRVHCVTDISHVPIRIGIDGRFGKNYPDVSGNGVDPDPDRDCTSMTLATSTSLSSSHPRPHVPICRRMSMRCGNSCQKWSRSGSGLLWETMPFFAKRRNPDPDRDWSSVLVLSLSTNPPRNL